MGAAIDALLSDDEKKRKQQQSSPSADGGTSYVNPSQPGSNIAALLKATKQPNYKPPQDAYTQPIKQQPSIQQPQVKKQPNIFGNIRNTIGGAVSNGISSVENFLNPTPQKTQSTPSPLSPPVSSPVSSPMQNTQIPQNTKKKLEPNYLSFPSLFDNPDKVQPGSATLTGIGSKPALIQAINPIDTALTAAHDFLSYHPLVLKTLSQIQDAGDAIFNLPIIKDTAKPVAQGIARGVGQQYLGSSQQVGNLLDSQLKENVTIEGKTLYTVGDVIGTAGAFIAGGEVLKAGQLGKATLPVLFATLGQLSSSPNTTIQQRLQKLPVDTISGYLASLIPVSKFNASGGLAAKAIAGFAGKEIVKSTGQGLVNATQSILNDVIDKKKPDQVIDDAKIAFIAGALFHIVGTGTGFLDSAILQSRSKTGTETFTPQDLRDVAAKGNMQNTKMGQGLENLAQMAEQKGKNVEINIEALQKTSVAKKLNLNKPEGIGFNAKLVDKTEGLPSGEGQQPTPEGMPNVVKEEVTKPQETNPEEPIGNNTNGVKTEASQSPETTPPPSEHNTNEATESNIDQLEKGRGVTNDSSIDALKHVRIPENFSSPDEEKSLMALTKNPIGLRDQYIKKFGSEVNSDNARELFKEYQGYNSNEIDSASGGLKNIVLDHLIQTKKGVGNNSVLITGGGAGSGKTTALKTSIPEEVKQKYPIIIDTTLGGRSTEKTIQNILDNGYNVDIAYVLRHPTEAWKSVIKRYRTVGEDYHLQSHASAQEQIALLHEKYKDNPKVHFHLIDNTGKPGEATETTIDKIKNYTYNKAEVRTQVRNITDEAYSSGQFDKQYGANAERYYKGFATDRESNNPTVGKEPESRSVARPEERQPTTTSVKETKLTQPDKYFINQRSQESGKPSTFKEVKAKPVDIARGVDSFIHRSIDNNKEWVVTEGKTGTTISSGTTQKEAIAEAKDRLEKNKERLPNLIENNIKQNGLSPRYAQEKPTVEKSSTFSITLDNGKSIDVKYEKNYVPGQDHYEFSGDATSETGFKSYFPMMDTVQGLTPEEVAKKEANTLAAEQDKKNKKSQVAKSDIIEPHEPTSTNSQPNNKPTTVSTTVPVGSKEPIVTNKNNPVNDQKPVQQQPASNPNSNTSVRKRPEPSTAKSERVDAVIGKSPKGRYEINKQVETIIDNKTDPLDPKAYTAEEKALLKKYSGYGGINKEDTGRGALDEFFTPPKVIDFMWQEILKLVHADDISHIIEPAIGTGNFLDNAPFPHNRFLGFEINKYSATVAQILHPDAAILNKNFQDLFIKNNKPVKGVEPFASMVVGNPPYGEYVGRYKGMGEEPKIRSYEEYFIKRSLDITKDNGVVAMVIPSSWIRGSSTYGKEEIAKVGKIETAYRLPNGVFTGTDVGTDIVIFRKGETADPELLSNDGYFNEHPENVLGNEVEKTGRYGVEKYIEGDLANIPLTQPVTKISASNSTPTNPKPIVETTTAIEAKPTKTQLEGVKKLKALYIDHTTKGKTKQIADISNLAPLEVDSYRYVTTDGSLDPDYIKGMPVNDKVAYFSYQNGKWYPDKAYIDSKNLYTLLDQLEQDKSRISKEQYDKQSKWLRDNLPAWTFLHDIKIDARHKMWNELEIDDPLRSGQTTSIKSLFISQLYRYPNTMMEGLNRGDVVGYLTDSNIKSDSEDQKKFISNNRSRIANKLLAHFLKGIDELAPGSKDAIETYYNRNFNAYKTLSHEYVPIITKLNKNFRNNAELQLNLAQRNAIGFLLSRGKGIAALDVGIGKTMTGIISIAESFERGWAKRAAVIAPNPSIGKQWIEEIQLLLPQAKIYDMTNTANLDKMRGVNMLEKSFLVLTGDGMEKIGLTEESYKKILPDIEEAVAGTELGTARTRAQEGEKAEQVIGQHMAGTFDDLTWESLGVDLMTLDEAHNYNHIIGSVPSGAKEGERKLNPYSGLNMLPSKRGIKAYVVGKHILKNNNQRNVFLMTATPFTNNPLEHYSMMSFVADKEMKERGVYNVREYIQAFMQMENQSVVNPAGQIVDKQVVTNFTNFDAYQQLLNSAMIKIDGEDAGVIRPKRIDKNVYVKTSEPQFALANKLAETYTQLSKLIKAAPKEKKKELSGMRLRVMTSLVANGFSPYASKFYKGEKPTYKEFVENTPKLKIAADMIKANLEKTKGEANSIVYIPFVKNEDLGINFHNLFTEYLIKEKKIKASDIATITGEVSRPQRIAIQNDFNAGKIKVLTGTYAIAEGLNLQKKTSDIFITSPFWNYTQFRQMAGRAWRQGNMWDKVRIHLLMAEGTGDTFVSQKIMEKERRDKIINQAVQEGKVIKQAGGEDLDFEEVLSSLLSDPVQRVDMQKVEMEKQLRAEIAGIDGQLQYARNLTDPYTKSRIQSEVEQAQRSYDRYASQLKDYQHTLSVLDDKTGEQGAQLQIDINRTKGYAKKESQIVRSGEARIKKIEETIARDGLTKEYITHLQTQLTEKQTTLQNIQKDFEKKMEVAVKEKAAMKWEPTDYQALLDKHIAENQSFYNLQKPAGNGAPGGNADVGGYADLKEVAQTTEFKAMQFPEILRMVQEIATEPVQLKKFKTALGRTYINEEEKTAQIALNKTLFDSKMPLEIKAKVAAHELGHLIDAMPDFEESRGNLLGHILTMQKFMKQTFGELSNKTIRNELKQLTQLWKPFDEGQNKNFTKYRYAPKELYADAISVLFNQPDLLKQTAPQFWKGFFDELNRKEDVKDTFFRMWDLLTKGEDVILSERREAINESFSNAEERWKVLRKEESQKKKDYWFKFKYDFLDKNQKLIDLVTKAKNEGKIVRDDLNPQYLLDERNYIGGKYKVLMEKEVNPIVQEFIKKDIPREALGEMMLLQRIVEAPERADIANPFGLDRETAAATLEKLEKDLGKENAAFVAEQATRIRNVYKDLLDVANSYGMFTEELYTEMKNNPAYATFAVNDYLDIHLSGTIFTGKGTLKGVADPFTATVMKMMGTIYATETQRVKLGTKEFLETYEPSAIQKPEYKFDANKQAMVPQESKDPDWKLVKYLNKGKVDGFLVDPYIATSLNYETHERMNLALQILKTLNSKWFRPVYIGFNTGFQTFNLARDYFRSVLNMPGGDLVTNAIKVGLGHVQALPHAIAKGFDKVDPLVQEMYEKGLFTIHYNDFVLGQTNEDKQLESILEATGVLDSKEKRKVFLRPFLNALDFIEGVGDTIMALPKIAGYTALKGKLPDHETGFFIRNYLGHSNVLTHGAAKGWTSEVFLFSNSITQAVRMDFNLGFQNPKTRAGWWLRFSQMTLLPKLLMFMATMGLFGVLVKKKMDDISEYDKTNYIVVPLGAQGDKTAYLRVPQVEINRIIGGVWWKLLNMGFNRSNPTPLTDSIFQLLSFTGGQLPSISPVLQTAEATKEYVSGNNPYDFYRGRQIIPDLPFKAGGFERFKPFATWLIQQMGGSLVLGASVTEKTPGQQSWLEKLVNAPIVSNVLGRWLKVSNYGQTELNKQLQTNANADAANRSIRSQDTLQTALQEYQKSGKTSADAKTIAHKMIMQTFGGQPKGQQEITEANNMLKKLRLGIDRGKVDTNAAAFIDATSNAGRMSILQRMKEQMTASDYHSLKQELAKYHIVSVQFMQQAHHAGL